MVSPLNQDQLSTQKRKSMNPHNQDAISVMQNAENDAPFELAENMEQYYGTSQRMTCVKALVGGGGGSHQSMLGKKSAIELAQESCPKKEGFLEKMSPSFFAGYQSRWCTLIDREFRYYIMDKGEKTLKGVINFDIYSVRIENYKENRGFYLRI